MVEFGHFYGLLSLLEVHPLVGIQIQVSEFPCMVSHGRGVLLPLLVALCGLLFLVVVQTMFSVMRTIVTELHMYVLFGRGVQIMVVVTVYGLYT